MQDRNSIETRAFENAEERAEQAYERKLALFRDDPYSFCEHNLSAFSVYDLLAVALEYILPDYDETLDFKAGQCSRKDIQAAIRDSIEKVEL